MKFRAGCSFAILPEINFKNVEILSGEAGEVFLSDSTEYNGAKRRQCKWENNRQQVVVTEDSNAGFEFFESIFCNSEVVSAGGNSNIVRTIEEIGTGDLLAIADGAAFGAMMENCMEYVSWERFFTDLLEKLTRDAPQHYTKHHLPSLWKESPDKEKIIKEFPEIIRENI